MKRRLTREHVLRHQGQSLLQQVTPEPVWQQRRLLLAAMGASMAAGVLPRRAQAASLAALPGQRSTVPGAITMQAPTAEQDVIGYNNFYEFGTSKSDPARLAGAMATRPWTVRVEGLVAKPRTFDIDDLLRLAPMEERIYRFRCVEAWSMVVPWVGYALSHLLQAVQPLGSAKYVSFITHTDPKTMPGLRGSSLQWPYTEGLRMDEAMHPLTLLTFGLYGKVLPNQNGAPLRLIVPWKYGFKSGKSLVTIRVTETQTVTAWNQAAPEEYGFYSNVNPQVAHPRWSQASERPLGGGLFASRVPTQMFNGYAEQVAGLYAGMDLRQYF